MGDPLGDPDEFGRVRFKSDLVAEVVNDMLYELCIRCAKARGTEDYFEVAVVGYGSHVSSAFAGHLEGMDLVPISSIAAHPFRIEEHVERLGDAAMPRRVPIWVQPKADGGTRMCLALQFAASLAQRFIRLHPDSFPPIVLNVTDGDATDGDPMDAAAAVTGLGGRDGAALLFNLHLGSSAAQSRVFPDREDRLPDSAARSLFRASSVLPSPMRVLASASGFDVDDRSRGFAYNADLVTLVKFLDIGTRALDLR